MNAKIEIKWQIYLAVLLQSKFELHADVRPWQAVGARVWHEIEGNERNRRTPVMPAAGCNKKGSHGIMHKRATVKFLGKHNQLSPEGERT